MAPTNLGQVRAQLLDTISLWVEVLPEPDSRRELAGIREDLDDTYFAWHGDTDGESPVYYRIQGPRLIIEFSFQGESVGEEAHIHSIYRDPTNEYGEAFLNADRPE